MGLGEGEGMMLGKLCPLGKEHREVDDANAMPLPALLLLRLGQLRGREMSKRRRRGKQLGRPTAEHSERRGSLFGLSTDESPVILCVMVGGVVG